MIKVYGEKEKSCIANAIHQYNGALIYSYEERYSGIPECYSVNSNVCSVKDFCQFVYDDLERKMLENENLPMHKMCVIYTNLEKKNEIEMLENYAREIEKMGYVGNVIIMFK